eukprot:360488-Chlamydomonas_euryale.AAC.20
MRCTATVCLARMHALTSAWLFGWWPPLPAPRFHGLLLQDTKDDSKIGIRSTALLFGENTKAILSGFAAASILGFSAAGAAAGMSWPYYAGTSAAAVHMAWQLGTVDLRNGPDCMAKFVLLLGNFIPEVAPVRKGIQQGGHRDKKAMAAQQTKAY